MSPNGKQGFNTNDLCDLGILVIAEVINVFYQS